MERTLGAEADRVAGGASALGVPVAIAARGAVRLQRRGRLRWATGLAGRALLTVLALQLFVLALEVLKAGAVGLEPLLDAVSLSNPANALGLGWLGAYGALSGSPVAAVAVALFGGGALSANQTFAMINGSRFGASFIVLVVGFIAFLRGQRTIDGVYIGVVALVTTLTQFLPVLFLGFLLLNSGWLDGLRVETPASLTSFIDLTADPVVGRLESWLPELALFAVGVPLLLVAFQVFDRVLPTAESSALQGPRVARLIHHPYSMFALGLAVTAVTLSVSLSLTILIPLSLKGYIRREYIVPYVMGANISTWVDTLFAAVVVAEPRAFMVVATEMIAGAAVSLTLLLLLYRPYYGLVMGITRRALGSRASLAAFLGAIVLLPALLLAV